MSDLAWLTLSDAAGLLRAKKLSPLEYTRTLIARVEQHDPKLNAFLRFTPDIAIEDARRAEACTGCRMA
jgi:aspartyl-tRNA(Asn)/glutamyl-tRNA(Gln) amidotransferase subunit A